MCLRVASLYLGCFSNHISTTPTQNIKGFVSPYAIWVMIMDTVLTLSNVHEFETQRWSV